jgi:hypothetical protein
MSEDQGASAEPTGLSSSTELQSSQGLGPSGFDPSRVPAISGCLWMALKIVIVVVVYQVIQHFADHLIGHLILDRKWDAYEVVRLRGGVDVLIAIAGVFWIVRDSDGSPEGRDPQGLDAKHDSAGRRHRPDDPA